MFTLYPRHLFKRFIGLLILSLGCTLIIFLVIDLVENITFWLNRPRGDALLYYFNYIPYIIYLILPIALLIATVFGVGGAARHLELVAMRSSGVSLYKVVAPIALFGLLTSGAMYYFNETVLADANHKRFEIKEPKAPENEKGNPTEKYKFVFIGPQGVTYFFQHYSGNSQRGREVTLLFEQRDTLYQRYDAKQMRWEDDKWVLFDGLQRKFEGHRVLAEKFSRREVPELEDKPLDLVNQRVFPEEMSYKELQRRIDILKRSGEETRRYETQLHFKVSGSVVSLVMVLFGISLSARSVRTGLAKKFGLAFLITVLYFILIRFGLILGENGTLQPVSGAWAAHVVFGGLALIFFLRSGR